jgi:hypothetical protein
MGSLSGRPFRVLVAMCALFLCARSAKAECQSGTVCTCPESPIESRSKDSRWHIVETENFQICCDESQSRAEALAKHSESLRVALRGKWLGDVAETAWSPKCQIVLHGKLGSYVSAVGRGSERTVGSSLVRADGGKILSRRIDLLGGKTEFLSAALPHELTHIVLKEKFVAVSMPRWADEGIAVLADPVAKQDRHKNDLQKAIRSGTTYQASILMALDDYPRPEQFGAFYGQSASLAGYLVEKKSPQDFVAFLEQARIAGYDSALRATYEIANVGELDRKWRESLPIIVHH